MNLKGKGQSPGQLILLAKERDIYHPYLLLVYKKGSQYLSQASLSFLGSSEWTPTIFNHLPPMCYCYKRASRFPVVDLFSLLFDDLI